MIRNGSYIVWCSKFGYMTPYTFGHRDDALELVGQLTDDNCDTQFFDSYGSPSGIEHVGHGMLDNYRELAREYREAEHAEWLASEAAKPVDPTPVFHFSIRPPVDLDPQMSRGWETVGSVRGEDAARAAWNGLTAAVGPNRVQVSPLLPLAELE